MVAPDARIGERQGYEAQLAGLWRELAQTLRRLESLAARDLPDGAADELSHLQYALHLFGERLVGMRPPHGHECAHEELAAALAGARDATAGVAEAAAVGGAVAAAPLVYEWRGALFRVRLARMTSPPPRVQPTESAAPARPPLLAPLLAFLLTAAGAAGFTAGAIASSWPLWVAGIVAVATGLLVYRP